MNFFGGRPNGAWPHQFTFPGETGCFPSFIGFVVFLVVVLILKHFLFP
jgi:hypothetical protein